MIKFSMILAVNNRSKAYLQNLLLNEIFPEFVIVLDDKNYLRPEHTDNDKIILKNTQQNFFRYSDDIDMTFDEKEHLITTLKKYNIKYILLNTININTDVVYENINKLITKYIIYSGVNHLKLGEKILALNKEFLYVHLGELPLLRGSTAMYYSMLLNNNITATIYILNNKLNSGDIVYKKEYKVGSQNEDFDYLLNPMIGADMLIEFFNSGEVKKSPQDEASANMMYIIHPLIKHLSILKIQNKI